MQAFLKDVAAKILSDHAIQSMHEVTVILPSRRSGLFFKKYLVELIGKSFIAPQIITINEMVENIAHKKTADNNTLLFELYHVYVGIEKENAEPFENFIKWGSMMLSDFNEIDRYLIDAKKLFVDLKNIQEIEDWSFNKDELTDNQKKFQSFWYKMGEYYQAFQHASIENGYFSSGAVYRSASENIDKYIHTLKDNHLYIAGFNALSTSEENIIEALCKNNKAVFLVDNDQYYVDNKNHEAGIFVRRMMTKKWFAENPVYEHFAKTNKKIEISGVPGNTIQASVAGKILSHFSEKEINDTVLVLADEKLLIPVIHSLPDNVKAANITMGYSLRYTTLFTFINQIFTLQQTAIVNEKGEAKFYVREINNFLSQPETLDLCQKNTSILVDTLRVSGKVYIEQKELLGYLINDFNIIKNCFTIWNNPKEDAFNLLISLLSELHQTYTNRKPLQQEFTFIALNAIVQLGHLLDKYPFVNQLSPLRNLVMQLLRKENVPFFGEPLKGLQIIGMLESRALDFKNVIVCSVNEDILPQGNVSNSLMPFDLKQFYKLPTYKETDAVFAHHFYRLIQRAENVYLLYNSLTDVKGGGEKSRFIWQIEEEAGKLLNNISVEQKKYTITHSNDDSKNDLQIKNNAAIIQKIKQQLENGISPSALSKFNSCPLDFYYNYIIGLSDKTYQEDIDDAKLGTIVHRVLEEIYLPTKESILTPSFFSNIEQKVDEILPPIFKAENNNHAPTSGKNYLSYAVIKEYVKNILEHDEKLAKKGKLKILQLEEELSSSFTVYPFGEVTEIKLKGKVDRIDSYNDTIRIIDYKTGSKSSSDTDINQPDHLLTKSKALQLLIYAYTYLNENKIKELNSLIYFSRLKNNPESRLKIYNEEKIQKEHFELLTETLTSITEKLLDETYIFEHNSKSKYCKFCN